MQSEKREGITISLIRGWEQDQGDVEIVLKRPELRRSDSAWTSTRFTLSVAVTAASTWHFHTLSVITFQQFDHLSWKWCQDGGCWLWLSQTESHRTHLRMVKRCQQINKLLESLQVRGELLMDVELAAYCPDFFWCRKKCQARPQDCCLQSQDSRFLMILPFTSFVTKKV